MLLISQVAEAYFAGLLFILFTFLVGKSLVLLFQRLWGINDQGNSVALFSGLLFITAVFAVIKTGGNTIMAGLLLVLIFIVFGAKKYAAELDTRSRDNNFYDLLSVSIYYSLFYAGLAFYCITHYQDGDKLYQCHQDTIFQLDIVEAIKKNGAENIHSQYNSFSGYAHTRQPYHYFEYWIAALISQVGSVNSLYVLMLSVSSILFSFSAFFIQKIALLLGISKKFSVLAPILIFIKLVYVLPFLSEIKTYTPTLVPSIKSQVYLFFLYFSIYFFIRYKWLAVIPILGLWFATISSVFSVAGVIGATVVSLIIQKEYKRIPFVVISALFCGAFLVGFYVVNGFIGGERSGEGFLNFQDLSYRTMINIIGGTTLQQLFLLLPWALAFLLIMVIYRKRLMNVFDQNLLYLVAPLVGAAIFGLFAWAILYKTPDSVQFFSNFFICATSAFLVVFLLSSLRVITIQSSATEKLALLPMAFLFGVSLVQSLQETYLTRGAPLGIKFVEAVKKDSDKYKNAVGGYFIRDLEGYSTFAANRKVYWSGGAVKLLKPEFTVVALNIHKVKDVKWAPIDIPRINIYFKESPLYKTLPDSVLNQNFDHTKHIMTFIRSNQIDFIIADKEAKVPEEILSWYRGNSYVDPVSGLRYYSRS